MKSATLEPNHQNVFETLKSDTLCRNDELWRLAELCDCQENSCAIALNGQWGSGKTFFVKQLQLLFEAYNDLSKMPNNERKEIQNSFSSFEKNYKLKPSVVFYYDAWENDNSEDPLLSLIYQMAKSYRFGYRSPDMSKITDIVCSIANIITGRNISELIKTLEPEDILEIEKKKESLHQKIRDFLIEIVEQHEKRLVIIVDELDRCRPDYAVNLLEKIKHYFFVDQVTFIFAVNEGELQHTIT
jgi:phage-related protein